VNVIISGSIYSHMFTSAELVKTISEHFHRPDPSFSAEWPSRRSLLTFVNEGTVKATATTSRRRGRPVFDRGSRGAVGVTTQDAGASYVEVAEADTIRTRVWSLRMRVWSVRLECGQSSTSGVWIVMGVVNKCTYWCIYRAL